MNKSPLVSLFGFPATLVHGDTLVLDRWLWLRKRLPRTRHGESLIDVGCGSGAFTIGAALRGYAALGLSWDERNQLVATERAQICKARCASFEILDVRLLASRTDLRDRFDFAICAENIEHILDDAKLVRSIAACLKPGGRLLLTAPFLHYRAITVEDMGPFSLIEDGWHVRRGYTAAMLKELCEQAELIPEEISYCSGFLSQKTTSVFRLVSRLHPILGWLVTLPLRPFLPIFDPLITAALQWPSYSICLEAYKPRFAR